MNNTPAPVCFTTYLGLGGDRAILSKTWELVDGELVQTESGGRMSAGEGQIVKVMNLTELGEVLVRLGPRNAASWGIPNFAVPTDGFTITVEGMEPKLEGDGPRKRFARLARNFAYPLGPAVFMIDVDGRPAGKVMPQTPAEIVDFIRAAIPQLEHVEMLAVPSGSACIYDEESGEMLRGITGWRVYVIVEDGSDIPRLGDILFKAMWLIDEGYIKLSSSGGKLERSFVDGSVWKAERLDFIGGANLGPGLVQKRPAPVLIPGRLQRLDSRAIPDLTATELAEYEALVAAAKAEIEPEAALIRAEAKTVHVERRVADKVAKLGRPVTAEERERLELQVEALLSEASDELFADDILCARLNGVWTHVAVADIYADPEAYLRARFQDPLDPTSGGDGGSAFMRWSKNKSVLVLRSYARGVEKGYILRDAEPLADMLAALARKLGVSPCLSPATLAAIEIVEARYRAGC